MLNNTGIIGRANVVLEGQAGWVGGWVGESIMPCKIKTTLKNEVKIGIH